MATDVVVALHRLSGNLKNIGGGVCTGTDNLTNQ
jgi:hypothetical protein